MKKIFFLLLLGSLFSCSSETDKIIISSTKYVTKAYPEKARIWDTITIEGNYLKSISQIRINNRFVVPIEQQENSIKFVIPPTIHNQKVNVEVLIGLSPVGRFSLDLIGTFPLETNFLVSDENLRCIKMVSKDIAFVIADSKLCKTIDGGYNWTLIKDFKESNLSSIFFINENQGWVATYRNSENIVHYTNDGGKSFNPVFEKTIVSQYIKEIYFSSPNRGYLLTSNGRIYETNDNSNFDLKYEFPNSGNIRPPMFSYLSVFNNTLIASSYEAFTIIKKKNNFFDYTSFNKEVTNIQLIDENQAYAIIGNQLYFTEDINTNWNKTSDKLIGNFYFISKNNGIGTFSNPINNYEMILQTYDGGKNWTNKFTFADRQNSQDIDFYENVGLIVGMRGHIWKHIYE
ncbi:IPT/TIG domain-containing protein [Flavobacterium fluvii]|uniref:IPT/TIG domain-containing protein n=1 Tax=Flavobacterium fluvii TaxID=468056 RepID=A0A1M5MEE0_9FLAO|nr:IPT/TIG domain-containing protein [Flavobacterium fluvii]SHG75680.1 IPT/TIG domain-containing protein [Flavobacterium fluvii]